MNTLREEPAASLLASREVRQWTTQRGFLPLALLSCLASAMLRLENEEGQSLVEFAVCVPVLLLIVTAIFTFGIITNNYLMLTEATNVGARQLAISRLQTTDPCSTASQAIYAAAPSLKTTGFVFTFVLNGTSYSGTSCTAGAGNLLQNTAAKVSVKYPCSLAVYGVNYSPSCSLVAQTTELVQ